MTKYCSVCGAYVIPPGLFGNRKFCENCGQPTNTALEIKCPNGHSMKAYENYCSICGAQCLDHSIEELRENYVRRSSDQQ